MTHREVEERILLTRKELFDRVWTTAMRNLAPELGLSDVGLRKLCRRVQIPTPPVGYWAKKESGKAPPRPRLPQFAEQDFESLIFYPGDANPSTPIPDEIAEFATRERRRGNRIVVPDVLTDPLPIVVDTMASLSTARPDEHGLVKPRVRQKLLGVQVSRHTIERAMRIMDALLKALMRRSLPWHIARIQERWMLVVSVDGHLAPISLHEPLKREEREPDAHEKQEMEIREDTRKYHVKVPSGRLCLENHAGLTGGYTYAFADRKRRPLEIQLNSFVISLYRLPGDVGRSRAIHERNRRENEERERQRIEAEERRAVEESERIQRMIEEREEQKRVDRLMVEVESWTKSQAIRRYIDAFRAAVIERHGSVEPDGPANRWIQWATSKADHLDPLIVHPMPETD